MRRLLKSSAVIIISSFIFLSVNATAQDQTYCNIYGNIQVCNTYHNNGTMDQEYDNYYGSTEVRSYSSSPYNNSEGDS